jgi:methionyl-tRNA formyltransferase
MKVVFFGASRFILPVIEMLNKDFDLALVVTTEQNPAAAVPFYCRSNNISYISISKFDDKTKQRLKEINAPLAILAYFGILLPREVLNIFPKGILNIHPSLLPLFRGATPVQSAILNGDRQTGSTIIKLDTQMDHGPILIQKKELIHEIDTTESLHDRLFKKGATMLIAAIPEYVSGKIKLRDQKENEATYTKRSFTRQDGYINRDKPPSKVQLDRMIRAYYPWPAAWTKLQVNPDKWKIVKFLPENKIQVEGGKPMSFKDFLNGYPQLKEELKKLLPI